LDVLWGAKASPGGGGNGVCENGSDLWYWVNDLVATLCCLERLNSDFQQLNGRSVGVGVAILFAVDRGDVRGEAQVVVRKILALF